MFAILYKNLNLQIKFINLWIQERLVLLNMNHKSQIKENMEHVGLLLLQLFFKIQFNMIIYRVKILYHKNFKIISNVFGFSNYDSGGDFVAAMNYIQENFASLETINHYQYNPEKYRLYHNNKQLLPLLLDRSQYYLPFQEFQNYLNPFQTSNIVKLAYGRQFNKDDIKQIKSYLSMGLAVAGAMSVGINTSKFMFYDGQESLYQECDHNFPQDHQITFIGYGKYKGEDVWLIQNSHGKDFGNNGTFFIPIGSNSFCIEEYAFGVVPLSFNVDEIKLWRMMGDHTQRKSYQLDRDNNELIDNTGEIDSFNKTYTDQSNNTPESEEQDENDLVILIVSIILCLILLFVGIFSIILLLYKFNKQNVNNYEDLNQII